jgi:hypothetical protein
VLTDDSYRIRKLLHWWIGLKACNVILARERLDRERRKKAENRQARQDAELSGQQEGGTPASFVALAPNSVLHDADTGSRGSPMSSSAMLTPPESGESPTVGLREGPVFTAIGGGSHTTSSNANTASTAQSSRAEQQQPQSLVKNIWNKLGTDSLPTQSVATPIRPAHPVDSKAALEQQLVSANQARQISVEVAKLVDSFRSDDAVTEDITQPNNSISYRGLDPEGLRALRQYIYGEESGVQLDEEALLNRLEKTWREGVRADYYKIHDNIPVFIARERAFLTWMELKRHLAALQRANERMFILLHVSTMLLIVDRLVHRRPYAR